MRFVSILALLFIPAVAVAKPNFHTQTNHIALKKGQEWSWAQIAKTPKIEWHQKTPKQSDGGGPYLVYGGLDKYGSFSAQGSKNKPLVIMFDSGQSYEESENGKDVYNLYQLFKKSELTRLKSNCTIKVGSDLVSYGEYQEFYKWHKKGYQPLYVSEQKTVSGTFGGGISINYNIVKDFNDFNNDDVNVLRFDKNYDEITCRILK